jgi:hypothetical protein
MTTNIHADTSSIKIVTEIVTVDFGGSLDFDDDARCYVQYRPLAEDEQDPVGPEEEELAAWASVAFGRAVEVEFLGCGEAGEEVYAVISV